MPSSWPLHWDEVSVFDVNSAALGQPPLNLMLAAGKHLANISASGVDDSRKSNDEIWILCGSGNNGGDGFVAAKVLADGDYNVRILASHKVQKTDLSNAARLHAKESEIPIHVWGDGDWDCTPEVESSSGKVAVLVDALLGVGQGGGENSLPRGSIAEVLIWTAEHFSTGAPRVLACDLPTGWGSQLQLRAGLTLTFHEEKLGMRDVNGEYHRGLGQVIGAPLPFPDEIENVGIGDSMRYPKLETGAQKGDRGRVLVIGGGPYHGAPILAGMAAARMGADLVHVAMPEKARERANWPPDIIPEEIPDRAVLTQDSIAQISQRMSSGRGVQAMVIGTGLGREESTLSAVRDLLNIAAEKCIPCVIDADAIYALEQDKWPDNIIGVATPHATEFSAWLGNSKPDEVLAKAAESVLPVPWDIHSNDAENAVIITTGAEDTLIGLQGRSCKASGGNPRMAMGGTGDLLAGAIGGLLAIGMSPWAASRLACYLMREAGKVAGQQLGPGLVSSDLPQYLAGALATALLIQAS